MVDSQHCHEICGETFVTICWLVVTGTMEFYDFPYVHSVGNGMSSSQLTNSMIFQRVGSRYTTNQLESSAINFQLLVKAPLIGGHFSSIYDPAGFSTLGECLGFVHSAVTAVRQKRGGDSNISTELIFMNRFTWGVRAVYKEFTIFHLTSNQLDIMPTHPMPLAHFEWWIPFTSLARYDV